MKVNDELYGQFEVEDLLVELIHSTPVQRLKGVRQAGAAYIVNNLWDGTRFDHSVGVMLLIRKLGGSLEEQVAGLLHDVSHTAFSHVIDFVFDIKEQDYHERIFEKVVMESEIPEILTKYGMRIEDVFNLEQWTILERDLPKLCADRLDYTLRDMYHYFGTTKDEITKFLNSLLIVGGEICILSVEMAEWFTEQYYKLVIDYFLSPINIYSYDSLAYIIKVAMNKEIINLNDLMMDDEGLLEIIIGSQDIELISLLEQLVSPVFLEENEVDYHIHRIGKARIIDVPVWTEGNKIQRASLISERVREMNEKAVEKSKKGTYVRVIRSS